LHDLRRTAATGLGNLGIRGEVIEAALGHRKKGIEKTYQLHPLLPERTIALDSWAARIEQILDPEQGPANVVRLRSGAV
jgi:hypothetical protein